MWTQKLIVSSKFGIKISFEKNKKLETYYMTVEFWKPWGVQ